MVWLRLPFIRDSPSVEFNSSKHPNVFCFSFWTYNCRNKIEPEAIDANLLLERIISFPSKDILWGKSDQREFCYINFRLNSRRTSDEPATPRSCSHCRPSRTSFPSSGERPSPDFSSRSKSSRSPSTGSNSFSKIWLSRLDRLSNTLSRCCR